MGLSEAEIKTITDSWVGYTEGSDCSTQKKTMAGIFVNSFCAKTQAALASNTAATENEKKVVADSCTLTNNMIALTCDETNDLKKTFESLFASMMPGGFGGPAPAAASDNASPGFNVRPAFAQGGPANAVNRLAAHHNRRRRSASRRTPSRR